MMHRSTAPAGTVKTAGRNYDTQKVSRTDSADHTLELWLASDERYLPVKVTTGKDGKVLWSESVGPGGARVPGDLLAKAKELGQ